MNGTCSNNSQTSDRGFTFKDLEKMSRLMYQYPKDKAIYDPKKASLIERMMAKLGWYRNTTVYIVDSSIFNPLWMSKPKYGNLT